MDRKEYLDRLEQLLLVLPNEEKEEALQYYTDYFDDAGVENEAQVIRELGSPEEVAAKIRAGFAGEYGEYSEQGFEDIRFQNNQEIMIESGQYRREKKDSVFMRFLKKAGSVEEDEEGVYEKEEEDGFWMRFLKKIGVVVSEDEETGWGENVYDADFEEKPFRTKNKRSQNVNIWKVIAIALIILILSPVIIPVSIGVIAIVFGLVVAAIAIIFALGVSGFAVLFAGAAIIVAGLAKVLLTPAVGILAAGIGCILLAIGILLSWLIINVLTRVILGIIRGIVRILGTPFRKAGAR